VGDSVNLIGNKKDDMVKNVKVKTVTIFLALLLCITLPAFAVDTTPPVTTASPAGGIYNTTQSVTLTANEPSAIHYTVDGSTPSMGSPVYSGPIEITTNTVIKFFGVDVSDNVASIKSATYTFDTTPPNGTIVINKGDEITPQTSVRLILSCSDIHGCDQVMFSNDTTAWSPAEIYTPSKVWTLSEGDGTKTVYVKFKDTIGNWSNPFSDSITLDTTIPAGRLIDTLPRTGLTTSNAMRDDGAIQAGAMWPSPRFLIKYRDSIGDCAVQTADCDSDSSNDEILDNLTGLVWVRDGNTTGPAACGSAPTKTWQGALDYVSCLNANNYLGQTDWRLPNMSELQSLVNRGQPSQAAWLDSQGFVNSVASSYWSSTSLVNNAIYALALDLNIGTTTAIMKTDTFYARCVRGQSGSIDNSVISVYKTGQTICYDSNNIVIPCLGTGQDGELQAGAPWPNPRFVDNGDNTVSDYLTGLVWTKDGNAPGPAACSPGTNKAWQDALDYVDCLNVNNYIGYGDWRLPNIVELLSLVNYGQNSMPAWLNTQGFENVQVGAYLTSTTVSIYSALAWYIDGDSIYSVRKTWSTFHARPVRGQTGLFGLSGVLISRGADVTKNLSVPIQLNAYHPNGVAEMIFSDDNIHWSAPEPYKVTKTYVLPSGDGQKSIFVRFRANGNTTWSLVYSDSIVLDTTAPVTTATPAGGLYSSPSVTLFTNELATIYFTLNGSEPTINSTVYSAPISITANTTIKFFAVDKVGNIENVKTETYSIDSILPSGSVVINGGLSQTNTKDASLTLSATDSSGVTKMMFRNEDSSVWSTPEAYSIVKLWTLSTGEGTKTVYAKFMDAAGNWSISTTDSITLDMTAPSLTISSPSTTFTRNSDVTFTIAYAGADSVTLNSGNVTLNKTGTASGIVGVSGTGTSTRSVTISGITGDGTLAITLAAATASDTAGNLSAGTGPSATFKVDNTIPVVNAGSNQIKNSQFTQTATANDTNALTFLWTKQTGIGNITFGSANASSTTVFADTDGTYILRFTANDAAGNSAYSDMTLTWDTVAPNTPLVNGAILNNSFTPAWNWIANGNNGSGTFRYRLDNPDLATGATVTTATSYVPGSYLSEGSHTLYVQEQDIAGNWSASGYFAMLIDRTSPSTMASIPGGLYKTPQTVTLSCSDGAGSGCKAIYYTTDNSTPTLSSTQYSGPVMVTGTTILKVMSVDNAGNAEAGNIIIYLFDAGLPEVAIASPQDMALLDYLDEITGTATDAGSGVALVEVQIIYGTKYMSASGIFTTTPAWLPAIGTSSWSFFMSSGIWNNNTTYTINARATDIAGNISTPVSITFTKVLVIEQAFTTLSLDPSTQAMLQNGTLNVAGKLTRLPDNGASLAGKTVTLLVTAPDATTHSITTTTYDSYGHYIFSSVSGFTQKGTYTVSASFAGTTLLAASTTESKPVLIGTAAGYAILIEGKIPNQEGLESHNKTTNRIYKKLKDRGFIDDNIYYFNYNTSQAVTGVVIDAIPTKAAIQTAITTWVQAKMNNSPAPLYLIMVDHGNPDIFYINNETITPTELALWVTTLESGLSTMALAEKRVIIIGSCYSGSFVPALAHSGRVIVTSAAADEESYKGPNEPDNISSGEFFLEELFKELGRGSSLGQSFTAATDATKIYTRKGGDAANNNVVNKYLDNAMQHPLLEDNSDGKASNVLADNAGDGAIASSLYLGAGVSYDTNSASNPADITEVTDAMHLDASTASALLWVKANDDSQVSSAWMEIRSPSHTLSASGGSNQLEVALTKALMTFNISMGRWEASFDQFIESGMYEVFYFVRDTETNDISRMKRSIVYKNKADNNTSAAFDLISPADATEQKTVLVFDWEDSVDPDGDSVLYTLLLSRDNAFGTIDYRLENLSSSVAAVGLDAKLLDLTTYYWKVIAIDSFGAVREGEHTRSFSTNNTNGLPGIFSGSVIDAVTQAPIAIATVSSTSSGTATTSPNGAYLLSVPTGTMKLTVSATGYLDASGLEIYVTSGSTYKKNISLMPAPSAQAILTVIRGGEGNGTVTSSSTGISCGVDCSEPYNIGSVVILTAIPTAESSFTGWSGACSGTGTCTITVDAAKNVTAMFSHISIANVPDGDLDGGGVSVSDALKALRIAVGIVTPTANDFAHGDVAPLVNGIPQSDAKIDLGDVIVILRRSVELVSW